MPSADTTPEVHPPPPPLPPCRAARVGDVTFASRQGLRRYLSPVEIVSVSALEDVVPALEHINALVDSGLHAAGFLSYEAAPAFDPAMKTHPPGPVPLLWFGMYGGYSGGSLPDASAASTHSIAWEPLIGREEYGKAVGRIRNWLAAGDTYQINYTFPMRAAVHGDPFDWFARLYASQPADFTAYLNAGRFNILSLSPELFFRLDGNRLETRPMKGTAPRGLWYEDDCARALELQRSEKERAENVMIVDLLRNDLGRISRTGSVTVENLFEVERYRTLWQMTSSIASKTDASLPEIIAALFPCGSVTGAPKLRSMEIIRELERRPRGVYCGSVGWMAPGRQAQFNVAIRTMSIDTLACEATYSVGSGITWDSAARTEYEECLLKARVLNHGSPSFELLESLLWDDRYFLLDKHLRRLSNSADYFGIPVDLETIRQRLAETAKTLTPGQHKVRLRVTHSGAVHVDADRTRLLKPFNVGLAASPVDSTDVFLYHKTTYRNQYDALRIARPEFDDLLLWNEHGEITESTIANIVVHRAGAWLTPPVSCGLLPGVMREHLLQTGEISEAVLTKEDLAQADSIALINSVRKWIEVKLADLAAA